MAWLVPLFFFASLSRDPLESPHPPHLPLAGYKLKLPTAVGVTPAVVANTEIEMCEKGRVSFWKTDALREPTDQYS